MFALNEFSNDCGKPSLRALTHESETVLALYKTSANPSCEPLLPLSTSAISEILAGKRQGLPAFGWTATFVLACQQYAARTKPGRRDQGTTILPHWHAIYSAHATTDPTPEAAPASGYRLSPRQQEFIRSHGPHGDVLIRRAQHGHPHARYRVALLLASDPDRMPEATGILIDVASTGHPLALDLLDTRDEFPSDWSGPAQRQLSRPAVGNLARNLAETAKMSGVADEANLFYRAAARCGDSEAIIAIATTGLEDSDPEAATWLSDLWAQSPAGRHRTRARQASPAERKS